VIRKDANSILLVSERYQTPSTSVLLFHFEPVGYASVDGRLKNCEISRQLIDQKVIYTFDGYYTAAEGAAFRTYSSEANFSRTSYASDESRERGEVPARSMNNREKWEFFNHPPQAVQEFYKLLAQLAKHLDADISTLPWDLCDSRACASAVATNRLESSSKESMVKGIHEDFNTETGLPFQIPILYGEKPAYFPCNFVNGEENNPWLVSLMLYATAENFMPAEYGLGTVFYDRQGEIAYRAPCQHMRFVLFEGEIRHSIESSTLPEGTKSWRISYVFKLLLNPKRKNVSLKKLFDAHVASYKHLHQPQI
jgi:hypothetical protein